MDPTSLILPAIRAALEAVLPDVCIQRNLRRNGRVLSYQDFHVSLDDYTDVSLFAIGKGAMPMADALHDLLSVCSPKTLVITKTHHADAFRTKKNDSVLFKSSDVIIHEGAHPYPDASSVEAGEIITRFLKERKRNSLLICGITGGASALAVSPIPGIHFDTIKLINRTLLSSGADIREVNLVRSRLDTLKRGGFVNLLDNSVHPVAFILSDVIGDPIETISSGLTFHPRAKNFIIGNNSLACEALSVYARSLGFAPEIKTNSLAGDALEQGKMIAHEIMAAGNNKFLIYGGETTVKITGSGKGGRNQELALAAGLELANAGNQECTVVAFGTDGTDGPTDAAGAWVNGLTMDRARRSGLDPEYFLKENDSYNFFNSAGSLIKTGPTGTNVSDIIFAFRPLKASA
ncbi:MAG: DUF4147 domain-containing protein [Verrucomicrobiota bacterium]|nr:DUF4147 domain-containing protein [Verrucomicrobiota bacterium]